MMFQFYPLGFVDSIKQRFSEVSQKISEFTNDHPRTTKGISIFLKMLPYPFNEFSALIWDSMKEQGKTPEDLLIILKKIEESNAESFGKIIGDVSQLLETSATKDDIKQLTQEMIETGRGIEVVLEKNLEKIEEKLNHIEKEMRKSNDTGERIEVKVLEINDVVKMIHHSVNNIPHTLQRMLSTAEITNEGIKPKESIMKKRIQEILTEAEPQRSMKWISSKLSLLDDDELTRELLNSGAVSFKDRNFENIQAIPREKQWWGLPERNFSELGFENNQELLKIMRDAESKTSTVVEQLAYVVLSHPKYRQRSFDKIKEKFRGLPEDELKLILLSIDAIPFVSSKKEFWGLKQRNSQII